MLWFIYLPFSTPFHWMHCFIHVYVHFFWVGGELEGECIDLTFFFDKKLKRGKNVCVNNSFFLGNLILDAS